MRNKNAPSQRQLRIGELIRHILAQAFLRNNFMPGELESLNLSVSEVRVSPDMTHADVFITGLAGTLTDAQIKKLNEHAGEFGKLLGQGLTTKKTPRLRFVSDTAAEQGRKIEALLNSPEVRQDWDR